MVHRGALWCGVTRCGITHFVTCAKPRYLLRFATRAKPCFFTVYRDVCQTLVVFLGITGKTLNIPRFNSVLGILEKTQTFTKHFSRWIFGLFWNFFRTVIIERLLIPRDLLKKIFGTQLRQKRRFSPEKMRATRKTGGHELPKNLDLINDSDHMASARNQFHF